MLSIFCAFKLGSEAQGTELTINLTPETFYPSNHYIANIINVILVTDHFSPK